MDILLQQIINGLVQGSIYAMVALGYTMVYGIMGLINFAHGEVVMIGTQTGRREEYEKMDSLVNEGAVILDDANPAELERFMRKMKADILVGGVKERPLAYKLGIAFCDHNHERKHALGGYEGVINFTKEINLSLNSPVWKYLRGA